MPRAFGLSLLLAAACCLAACARSPTEPAVGTPSSPDFIPPGLPRDAGPLIDKAEAAAAQQAGAPSTLVGVRMVEWRDASLGCPEPGVAYAQTVTPGYLIKLSAGGKTYEYHTDRQGTVVTCANPQPPTSKEEPYPRTPLPPDR